VKITVFQDVMPCNPVDGQQPLWGTWCL